MPFAMAGAGRECRGGSSRHGHTDLFEAAVCHLQLVGLTGVEVAAQVHQFAVERIDLLPDIHAYPLMSSSRG